ncbi:MAG: DUF6519 domain-containing protein [Myxococcota bacterium]
MHGDLSRVLFDPTRSWTSVRLQQGRVLLDADFNEATDLVHHDVRTARIYTIGPSGTPDDEPGFGITNTLQIEPGRYWVGGIRVENAELVAFADQPDAPGVVPDLTVGAHAVWLEVWEAATTALEAPHLREVALGGPDATLRHRAAWAVRHARVDDTATLADARQFVAQLDQARSGGLRVREQPTPVVDDVCIVPPSAGYRGLDNRLYRVEIATGDVDLHGQPVLGTVQYVWSRSNASEIASIADPVDRGAEGVELRCERLGPGGTEGLRSGDLVELTNDARTALALPKVLGTVERAVGDVLVVRGVTFAEVEGVTTGHAPRLIRWDGGSVRNRHVDFEPLEDGVEVAFAASGYRTGDFWLIGARTAELPGQDGRLQWPADETESVAPMGVMRHRALLAVAVVEADQTVTISDARRRFTSLTELTLLTTFAATSGDGQHGRGGQILPSPLSALVFRGDHPEPGVRIRFEASPGGALLAGRPDTSPAEASVQVVTTDANGLAEVWWRLASGAPVPVDNRWPGALSQFVRAVRIGPDDEPIGPVQTFRATRADGVLLSIVAGDGQLGRPDDTLDLAMRVRATWEGRPVRGQTVTFEIDRAFNGRPLTEAEAGGMNTADGTQATGERWPNSQRFWRMTVRTDDDGIALAQLTLGDFRPLWTRFVRAWLPDVPRTDQTEVRLTATMLLAEQADYAPQEGILAEILGSRSRRTVGQALDELSRLVAELTRTSGTGFAPFGGLEREQPDGTLVPVPSGASISLADFLAFRLREKALLNPGQTGLAQSESLHGGVRIEVDLPVLQRGPANQPIARAYTLASLRGDWRLIRGEVARWQIAETCRSWLNSMVFQSQSWSVSPVVHGRIVVVPRHLPRAQPGDSTQRYEWPFTLTR